MGPVTHDRSEGRSASRTGTYTRPVADERFEEHLRFPQGLGSAPAGGVTGSAGGAACGDLVVFTVSVAQGAAVRAGFQAAGCGALTAAASALCTLVEGLPVLDAAAVGSDAVAAELGGLSAPKRHAAELVADAFHRALGGAVAEHGALPADPELVLVAMSGGVDSAVAALLSGPRTIAVTVELWRDEENDPQGSCCSASAVRAARAIAHEAGIPHLTVDLRDAFRAGVVEPWVSGHAGGETPNPCVRCNGAVRLDAMVALADRLGAAALATGHYARVTADGLIRAGADPAKDQSYMLAGLQPQTISRLRFPLGGLTKPRVRAIAREHGLKVADAPESQDLCFLAGTRHARFLERHGGLSAQPGAIVDRQGREVGRHDGHFRYTVGQRRGLQVHRPEPVYVLATDPQANTVTVGPREALERTEVPLRDVQLHRPAAEVDGVRLRYRSAPVRCALDGDRLLLAEPFRAPAPGQAAVLLRGDVVVGCGTISRT